MSRTWFTSDEWQEYLATRTRRSGECLIWVRATTDGYGHFRKGGQDFLTHRVAYEFAHGAIPAGLVTCFNHPCVEPTHLRPATRKQNNENRQGAHPKNRSGHRGVCWNANARKWQASAGGKYLGLFVDPADAAAVARRARLEMFTHTQEDAA